MSRNIDYDYDEKELMLLLQKCETTITTLLSQLEEQQHFKVSLEHKLVVIRSSKAPVIRLPKELLSMIFSELVRDDPQAIGPILFVCRQWHDVARNSPTLWSNVSARFLPHIPIVERTGDYITTAIRYSGNTPLHIDIRFPSLESLLGYMACKILGQPVDYQAAWDLPEDPVDAIGIVIQSLSFTYKNSPSSLLPYKIINSAIYDEMIKIRKALETNIFRLRSLTLYLHSREFSEWLFRGKILFFSNANPTMTPTPMLEELTVVDNHLFHGIMARNFIDHPIASLVRLSWGCVWPVETVLAPLGRLTHLRLLVENLPDTDYTYNITHMFLQFATNEEEDFDSESFSFPSLKDLTLYGNVPTGFLKIPQLSVLRLIDDDSCRSVLGQPLNCPSLERLHIWANPHGLESLDLYLTQTPSPIEVAFLYSEEGLIRHMIGEMKLTKKEKMTVKGYLYDPETRWSFDSYEPNEILVEELGSSDGE